MQSIHKTDHLYNHISDQTIEGNVVILVKKIDSLSQLLTPLKTHAACGRVSKLVNGVTSCITAI